MNPQPAQPDLTARPAWMLDAACRDADPEAFFPEKGGSTLYAKRICADCPVAAQCLDLALTNGERFGIWGGLSERERRRLNPSGPSRRTAACGTDAGYQSHLRADETACPSCREAHRLANMLRVAS